MGLFLVANNIFKSKTWVFITLLLVIGGLLRFLGINFGLPIPLHPDEGTIINSAIKMAEAHSFEPNVFSRPDHLEIKMNMISFVIVSHLFFHNSVVVVARNHLDIFYLAARILTACFSLGIILLSYLVGSKINKGIGLIAAVLFTIFPGFIESSHFATPDIPTAFFMLLCIYFCIFYMQNPSLINLALICLSIAGFAVIKYPGLILCSFVAIVIILQGFRDKNIPRIVRHGLIAVAMIPFFIFIISPVLFTNYHAVIAALKVESNPVRPGADGLGYFGNLMFYVQTYLSYSGLILTLFFVIGVYLFFIRRVSATFIPVFFSLIYFFMLSFIGLHWERWAIPMYVSPLLISAIGIYYVYFFIKKHYYDQRLIKIIFYISVSIVLINLSIESIAKMSPFLASDSRVLGNAYCKKSGIWYNNSYFEGYTPLSPTFPSDLPSFKELDGKYYPDNHNIKYVMISEAMYGRYLSHPKRFPDKVALYKGITEQYNLIRWYDPPVLKQSAFDAINIVYGIKYLDEIKKSNLAGPQIKIFQIK